MQTDSLNFATVFGFLQVLVQFDDPFLILLLLDTSNLLQLAGPLVFQHLINTDKGWGALIWKCFLTLKRTHEQDIQNVFDRFHEMFAVEWQLCAQVKMFDTAAEHPTSSFTCCASKCWEATAFTSWSLKVFPSSCITLSISVFCLPDRENSLNWLADKEILTKKYCKIKKYSSYMQLKSITKSITSLLLLLPLLLRYIYFYKSNTSCKFQIIFQSWNSMQCIWLFICIF